MNEAELNDVCDQLFGAFVAHDLDAFEALMAPDATVSQNGTTYDLAAARVLIEGLSSLLQNHRYTDVRRTIGADAIVEEHHVRATTANGVDVDLPACVVVRVNADGKIASLDEYVDTAPLMG